MPPRQWIDDDQHGHPGFASRLRRLRDQHGGYAYISSLEPKMQGYPGYQGEVKLSQLAGQYFSAFVFGSPDEATRFADAHGGEFGTDVDVRTSNNVTIAYFKGRDAAAGAVLEACAVHH